MVNDVIISACRITLDHKDFLDDYIQLVKDEFGQEKSATLSNVQVSRLLETAGLFSLNTDNEVYQKLAFKIAIFLFKQYRKYYPIIPFVIQLVITRLGDLPAIKTIEQEEEDGEDLFEFYYSEKHREQNINIFTLVALLKFPEIAVKKVLNRISFENRQPLVLTDFQTKLYGLLQGGKSVIFSAPTSAGKSYLVHSFIADRLKNSSEFCVLYMAPNKALISEVQASIRKAGIDAGLHPEDFTVQISTNPLNYGEIMVTRKKVFVLTPERLQEMVSNNLVPEVDLFVLDEAHKVNDKTRGIIIEDSVRELFNVNLRNEKPIQKIFIAPYVENLDKFKKIFNSSEAIDDRTSKSPVAQNFFYVDFKTKTLNLSLVAFELRGMGKHVIPLERRKSKEKYPTSATLRKSWVVANLIPPDEPTLVYCNTRYYCRLTAEKIADNLGPLHRSEELDEAIAFVKERVHPQYYLIDALKNKIGYHYGRMPQFVRYYVKDLFERKVISILCCTSTLLEGVNLPAKNIVLHNPKLGNIEKMDRLSLLNLAGRAGRLMRDYYGKVYCINQGKWDVGEDVFEERLEQVESSAEKDLELSSKLLIEFLDNPNTSTIIPDGIKSLACSFIIKQLNYGNSDFLKEYRQRHKKISQDDIERVGAILVKIAKESTAIRNIALKNRSIDPRFQLELYRHLKNEGFKPLICPREGQVDYQNLLWICERIARFLLRENSERYVYIATLATKWITQRPYKELILSKIEHNLSRKGNDEKKFVNEMIDELDDDIEKTLKYDYTRGIKCYLDIVEEIKQPDSEVELCKEFPLLLEAGASDKRMLLLLASGLSRNSAIEIYEYIDENISTTSDCIKHLKEHLPELQERRIPRIVVDEIIDITASNVED